MQLAMVGLGRMGANLARRLARAGHDCVVHDRDPTAVATLTREGMTAISSLTELRTALSPPRVVWIMVPAAATGSVVDDVAHHLDPGDIVIDGGNSHYHDDVTRSDALARRGVHLVDCGTSGGVRGLERGFCLMIGGPDEAVAHCDPIWRALAPGVDAAPRTAGLAGPARTTEHGYLHCGPTGAGHFVKMVHNGVEYALMAAYAEGLHILHRADAGTLDARVPVDAETAPMREPERYRYELDVAAIAELWRRGSVVSSWLLDLTASALAASPDLSGFEGRVGDSGEGRWTLHAAIDEGVPAPVIAAALFERFASRGAGDFASRALSAMRHGFGGHEESAG